MANDLTKSPWLIDTESATTIHANTVWVESITWSGYNGAADQCIIGDARGTIFNLKGTEDLQPIHMDMPSRMRGLIVSTLSSGVLVIAIK